MDFHGDGVVQHTIDDGGGDDAIMSALNSTRNRNGEHDPEIHQIKKGNEWHFGMKADIDIDRQQESTNSVVASTASVVAAGSIQLSGGRTGASRGRANEEHLFPALKVIFGFCKMSCRATARNAQRLDVTCALVNLFMLRRQLLRFA